MAARSGPDAGRRAPTLEQVASLAGVGRGTASRALTGAPQVSPRARAAVERAAAELGYRPNRAARSLVTRRSGSLGLVLSETEEQVFGDPFFAAVVRGVNEELLATDVQLVLMITRTPVERERLEHYAVDRHVDGMILVSSHGDDPLPGTLAGAGVPVAVLGRPAHDVPGVLVVDADNRGGARAATEHLVAAGRRRIATIAGPQDMAAGADRLEGYREALVAARRRPAKALVGHSDYTVAGGRAAMERLLRREPGLDAVLAASDLVAAGALQALAAAGRRVPEDVAVVGFDDIPLAAHLQPALTTVRQPIDEMGRRLARMLLDAVAGRAPEPSTVVLPTELVVRASG
ncbi:LacI family DNA-binding transcriptional regulator [Vallicoccus soli]|uniref:LacI family transcriptional regulator n=1 Tax=Vallicoccus soli TaxID=2339232 RepID=A0A3A3Z3V1_9ACTN|nr:LacI family DNA-binding transcriptional regulator [Vallicoccus soli]RJK97633.1 LacI family transcriptional regulator [Vallicoccus soli]